MTAAGAGAGAVLVLVQVGAVFGPVSAGAVQCWCGRCSFRAGVGAGAVSAGAGQCRCQPVLVGAGPVRFSSLTA